VQAVRGADDFSTRGEFGQKGGGWGMQLGAEERSASSEGGRHPQH
jgi:hypothetical protein